MSVAVLPITGFSADPAADRALSEEARILHKLITAAAAFAGSLAFGEPKRLVQESLAAELRHGEAAAKVEPSTYIYARQFLGLVSSCISIPEIHNGGLSIPEVSIDDDGEIMFEWDYGPRQVFSVSVGRDGTLTFAGLFGHSKVHGTELLRDALPSVISDCLKRLPSVGS